MQIHKIPIQVSRGEWQWFCGMSDLHFGSAYCDENHIKKDLAEAKERKARILIVGDVFDLLLPKDLKRFKTSDLAKYLQNRDDIINECLKRCFELLKDYAEFIDIISLGNHEFDLIKYHSTDIVLLLIELLNQHLQSSKNNHKIIHGGIIGYLQYIFSCNSDGGKRNTNILYYHGKGGEAPMTKGILDVQRMKINYVYDVLFTGHKHNLWADTSINVIPSNHGLIQWRPCRSVQCGTYQKAYDIEKNVSSISFEEQKAFAPKEIGCAFVKIRWTGHQTNKLEIKAEV